MSAAIREKFGQVGVDLCTQEKDLETVDVGCDEGFAKLLRTRATWMHGAPPCKTFSRARRTDQFASAKCLRTLEKPQGFGSEATDVANKLAMRMLEMARGQMKRGAYFSIENPFSSLIWRLKAYASLAGEENVRMVRLHQCMVGSMHKKETGILTNAPWLVDVLCDEAERPHHHVPLMGIVKDYRETDTKRVFYTELAAEYPEGLCNMWAECFHKFSGQAEGGNSKQRARSPAECRQLDASLITACGGGAARGSEDSSKRRAAEDSRLDTSEDGRVDTSNTAIGSVAASGSGVRRIAPRDSADCATEELQEGVPIAAQKATNW